MPLLMTLVAVATPLKMKKTKKGRNTPEKEAGGVRPNGRRSLCPSYCCLMFSGVLPRQFQATIPLRQWIDLHNHLYDKKKMCVMFSGSLK